MFSIVGDINALVQEELSGQLKDSLKLESSPLKAHPPHHKSENKEYQVRLLLLPHTVLDLYHNTSLTRFKKIEHTNIFFLGFKMSSSNGFKGYHLPRPTVITTTHAGCLYVIKYGTDTQLA